MASGISRMPPAQDVGSRILNGAFKAFMIHDQRKYETQQAADQRAGNMAMVERTAELASQRDVQAAGQQSAEEERAARREAFNLMVESIRAGAIPDDSFYQQAQAASGLPIEMVRPILDAARRGYEATSAQKEAERKADYQRATDVAKIGAESRETVAGMKEGESEADKAKKADAVGKRFTSIMSGWQKRQDAWDKMAAERPNDPALKNPDGTPKAPTGVPQTPEGWELGDDMYRELVGEEMAKSDVPKQSQAETVVRGHFYATQLAEEFGIDPLEPLDPAILERIGVKGVETLSDLVAVMVTEEGKKRSLTLSELRELMTKYQQAAQVGQFGQAYRGALEAK